MARAAAAAGEAGFAAHEIVLTATLTGVIAVAVVSAVAMMRARAQTDALNVKLLTENSDLKAQADRAEALLDVEDQLVVAWLNPGEPPVITGALGAASGVPKARAQFLAFGSWLTPDSAAALDRHIADLRERGTPFVRPAATISGTHVEVAGRIAGGRPFVRFRDLGAERLEFAELAERHGKLVRDVELMKALLEAIPMPIWLRDPSGRLTWANPAYAKAVDAADPAIALRDSLNLLDTSGAQTIAKLHANEPTVRARLPVVVAGARRTYDIVAVAQTKGSAGIGIDVSDLEHTQAELRRTIDFHARTLDQMATAVAIFGADKRLQFYNAAFRSLWSLDTAFLEAHPEDGAVLDQLRASRKLPEQADFRVWKRDMQSAYQAVEAKEHWWHLPDGQTLRVIANPHPQGGVTYIYENVTERLELEKRNNALLRIQGETLDHLSEGVVVFGSDGRIRLWNPPFVSLWRLSDTKLSARPHISEVISWCSALSDAADLWRQVQLSVTGLAETRDRFGGRMERKDGSVIDYGTVPLPDGGTLITFVNVTDTVNVERALLEKNDALEEADQIKTDFVGLVSYELRSPLTNIIGFAHLLADARIGTLNEKQRDYAGHIMSSSQALMAIVDDILDLATIDAGIMQLQLGEVDLTQTVNAAIEGVKDRIAAERLTLVTELPRDVGSFQADEKRIRQVLFNLLSNAIRFSHEGGTVSVKVHRSGDEVILMVSDQGVGIPPDQIRAVFDRFYARKQGPHRGGAGLGLSIVKNFVELHGGTVEIDSSEGAGTAVTCRFPSRNVAVEFDREAERAAAHG